MCAEKIEELTEQPALTPPKTPAPWGPALTVLICLPILSFVLSEYVLFPRFQTRLEQTVGSATTSVAPAQAPASHEIEQKVQTYEIKDVVSNLVGAGQTRYIRVSFMLESKQADFIDLMKKNETRFIDTTLGVLSVLSTEDLSNPNIENVVRSQLLQKYEQTLQNQCIEGLFFSQFVIK